MIVPDTSVWIDRIRGIASPAVLRLDLLIDRETILVGDIVLLEILQGARDKRHAATLQRMLFGFQTVAMLDAEIAVRAAMNYRRLRALGHTPRRTTDLIIGTFCIERGNRLLHSDRDFTPMVEHLGLQLA